MPPGIRHEYIDACTQLLGEELKSAGSTRSSSGAAATAAAKTLASQTKRIGNVEDVSFFLAQLDALLEATCMHWSVWSAS